MGSAFSIDPQNCRPVDEYRICNRNIDGTYDYYMKLDSFKQNLDDYRIYVEFELSDNTIDISNKVPYISIDSAFEDQKYEKRSDVFIKNNDRYIAVFQVEGKYPDLLYSDYNVKASATSSTPTYFSLKNKDGTSEGFISADYIDEYGTYYYIKETPRNHRLTPLHAI